MAAVMDNGSQGAGCGGPPVVGLTPVHLASGTPGLGVESGAVFIKSPGSPNLSTALGSRREGRVE